MDIKEIKAYQKKLRRQIITIIDTTPGWSRLPEYAPEIRQVRKLQQEISELEKMRSPNRNKH